MKTLAGWIVGVFALGLVAGSFFGGTAALETNEPGALEEALAGAPLVDCGSGREAVLEPVLSDGQTTVRVKCVPTAEELAPVRSPVAAPAVVYTAAAAPAPAPTPITRSDASDVEEKKSRTLKESALIIGGSAGAGAGIGALAKGKKGAAVGAAIGGVAGTVYDLVTRNKK